MGNEAPTMLKVPPLYGSLTVQLQCSSSPFGAVLCRYTCGGVQSRLLICILWRRMHLIPNYSKALVEDFICTFTFHSSLGSVCSLIRIHGEDSLICLLVSSVSVSMDESTKCRSRLFIGFCWNESAPPSSVYGRGHPYLSHQ